MDKPRDSRRAFLRKGAASLPLTLAAPLLESQQAESIKAAVRQAGGAIATSNVDATAAGADVLREGGNAIDAAVAAFMVQTVREPNNTGLGGYGGSMILYQAATRRVHAIDFDSRTPLAFRPELYATADPRHGYLAVGTPGVVAGLDLALREFGTLSWGVAARHAIAVAENGFRVGEELAALSHAAAAEMDDVSRCAYFPYGVPVAGQTWPQKDLARLFRRLGEEGPRSFYTGDVAKTIVRQVQENGGILSEEDLRIFEATAVTPLSIDYRGYQVYTPPPPAGGLTFLSILKTLENFPLADFTPWDDSYFDLFTQASRLCWAERTKYFGDPDFVRIPIADLLSSSAAQRRAETIRRRRISASGFSWSGPKHTCNVVAIDEERNIASITATHGGDFGSRVAIEGLGLMLGHGMSRFSFKSPGPNYPAPGKRMQNNMCPVVILSSNKPYAGLGLPGGEMIVSVTAQLVVNLIDFHVRPEKAVTAPRIHVAGEEPILLSPAVSDNIADGLEQRGYRIRRNQEVAGDANVAIIDPKSGQVTAAASGGSETAISF